MMKGDCFNRLIACVSLDDLQSPPKGATIPYRPKPQVGGPVILAGGQAYTIQGNYAVPATPDVSSSSSGCSAVAAAAAVAAVMSSSLSPTSISSSSAVASSSSSISSSSNSSSTHTFPSPTSQHHLHSPYNHLHHHNNHTSTPTSSSLGGCCSLPRFPAGMGLSMMHSHDFCSTYSPTPTATTCPMIGFGHQSMPMSMPMPMPMSMMQGHHHNQPAASSSSSSCTSNYSNPTPTPSSLCSSSISSSSPTSGYHHLHHHHHPTLVPWISNHQASSPLFAVSPVSSMSSPTACSIHPSKNGTISLATVSVPLSFYLGGGGGGGGGAGGDGDGTGRVVAAPPHSSSHVPVAASTAAYSAYSPSPVHMDVSLFLEDKTCPLPNQNHSPPKKKTFERVICFKTYDKEKKRQVENRKTEEGQKEQMNPTLAAISFLRYLALVLFPHTNTTHT